METAQFETDSLSIIRYVRSILPVHGVSDLTVAMRLMISLRTFTKFCHQSAAIRLRIKPRACGRVRHVPDVGCRGGSPLKRPSSVVEPH